MAGSLDVARSAAMKRLASLSAERAGALRDLVVRVGVAPADANLESLAAEGTLSEPLLLALEGELARGSTLDGSDPAIPSTRRVPSSDRFVVLAHVGAGRMGDVYRAFDRKLERSVALKVLRAVDPAAQARLRSEARAQARVEHPGVCRIFDVEDEGARGFLAMELIEGDTLDVAAAAADFAQRLAWAIDVADAVGAAHERGVLHRDLKPQNVLVTHATPRRAVVTDFGLAREVTAKGSGGIAGTPAYMAPEQARGDADLSPASDVWGLGATVFALFASRPPFPGTRDEVLLALRANQSAPVLSGVPRAVAVVVARCLDAAPAARYRDANEVAAALRQARDTIARASVARRRLVLALATGALVAGALAIPIFARQRSQQRVLARTELASLAARQEARMRQASLSPMHDLTAERAASVEALRVVDAMLAGDATIDGARAAARGRILLAAGDRLAAETALSRAHALGERSVELLLARARLALERYERAVDASVEMTAPARAARMQRLDRELRAPIVNELQELPENFEAAALLTALSRDPLAPSALGYGRAWPACEQSSRDAEPCRIAADDASREARRFAFLGQHQDARVWLARAANALAKALDIARSDPSLHLRSCEVAIKAYQSTDFDSSEVETRKITADARRVCQRAASVAPDEPRIRGGLAFLDVVREDEPPQLTSAALLAELAIAAAPDDVDLRVIAGFAQRALADARSDADRQGPVPLEYARAELHLRHTIAALPERADLLARLGRVLTHHAEHKSTTAPRPMLEEALALCRASHALVPDNLQYRDCLPEAIQAEAQLRFNAGEPYRALFDSLLEAQKRSAERYPDDRGAEYAIVGTYTVLTSHLTFDHQPDLAIAEGYRVAAERYHQRFPGDISTAYLEYAEASVAQMQSEIALRDPRPALLRLRERVSMAKRIANVMLGLTLWQTDSVALAWCRDVEDPCLDWIARAKVAVEVLDHPAPSSERVATGAASLALRIATLALDRGEDATLWLARVETMLPETKSLPTLAVEWRALTARNKARQNIAAAMDDLRAGVAELQALIPKHQSPAALVSYAAMLQLTIARHTRAAADLAAARESVLDYARRAPAHRQHRGYLERQLAALQQ